MNIWINFTCTVICVTVSENLTFCLGFDWRLVGLLITGNGGGIKCLPSSRSTSLPSSLICELDELLLHEHDECWQSHSDEPTHKNNLNYNKFKATSSTSFRFKLWS